MTNRLDSASICVVVGAARGIGYRLTADLVQQGHTVVAGCRTDTAAAELHSRLGDQLGLALHMDVRDPGVIQDAAAEVADRFGRVDVLIVCAGVTFAARFPAPSSKGPIQQLQRDALIEVMEVNAIGPVMVLQQFLPLLANSSSGVSMLLSSDRGSVGLVEGPGSIAYSMSKSALNMAIRKISLSPERGRSIVFGVHPGWVRTELGGSAAPTSTAEASASLIALVNRVDSAHNGRLLDVNGTALPW